MSSSNSQRILSAIGLAFLALLTTVLFTCYVCRRISTSLDRNPAPDRASTTPAAARRLPHVIFVAEADGGEEAAPAGSRPAQGLDQAAINSYPKFPFSKPSKAADGGRDVACPICLCEYREGEMLRVMPGCLHGFHLACIDAWLRLSALCPVCRTSPALTPPSTPLAELVPLSHFAADRRRW